MRLYVERFFDHWVQSIIQWPTNPLAQTHKSYQDIEDQTPQRFSIGKLEMSEQTEIPVQGLAQWLCNTPLEREV